MFRKHLAPAAAALAVACTLTACGAPASAPPGQPGSNGGSSEDKIIIGVGGQTLLTYLPTTLAQELGYYKEAGLNVELQDLQGGSKALTAMVGGSTQVTSGYYEHTIQMQAKNQDIKAFVDMGQSSGVALLVAPKNRDTIKTVADLKGKNVGITAPGSSTDMYVKYLLNKNNMSKDDASVSAIGAGSTAVAAMQNNQVDAAVMLEPDITVLNKRVGAQLPMLGDLRTREQVRATYGTDTWPSSCLYAKSEWLQKNPEKAKKLAGAIAKTLDWVQNHSAEEIAAKMPESYAAGDRAQYAQTIDGLKHTLSKDGKFTPEGANAVLDTQRVANPEVGEKKIDLNKTYTNEYLG